MPFRLWFYLAKVGGPILFIILATTFFSPSESMLGRAHLVAMFIVVLLGLVGALMGFLMGFDKLRMLCPFCGKSGRAGGNQRDGLCMECESCGFIHGAGLFRMKIVREAITEEARRAPGQ